MGGFAKGGGMISESEGQQFEAVRSGFAVCRGNESRCREVARRERCKVRPVRKPDPALRRVVMSNLCR